MPTHKQSSRTFRLPRRLARACAILPFVILQGCGSLMNSLEIEPKGTVTNTDSFCTIAQPIMFSRLHDTEETIEAVKEHNAVGKRLCGWKAN